MAVGAVSCLVLFAVTSCLVQNAFGVNCNVPIGCTASIPATCFFPPECHKAPIRMGGEITLGKRDVDCDKPMYCDRCIPMTCYYSAECHKDPVTSGPVLGTLGKRCSGNFGTLG